MELLCKNGYKLEKVQRAAIRNHLGVYSTFPPLGLEFEVGWMPLRWEAKIKAIKYHIKASRNDKMRLLNRVMAWANEGVGWMEEEGSWSAWGGMVMVHRGDLRRFVTSSGERDVRGMHMEEAPGKVERRLQQITEVKILGSFSRRYSFCRVEDGRSS